MKSEFRLIKQQFNVIQKEFNCFGNDGLPRYDYRKEVVNGEVFRYKGLKKSRIYRTIHQSSQKKI